MCETCHNGIHPVGEGISAVKAQYLIPSIQEGPGKKQPRADDEVIKSFLVWQQLVEFHEIIRQRKDEC